jgi:hypothetical protein
METSELLRWRLLSQQQTLIAVISSLRAVTGTTAAGAATCTELHAPPEKAGDNDASRTDGPAPVIPPVEMRGITLAQLRKVYAQIEHRCVRDHWTDKETQCPLEPHKVNLYHLNKYFIMKETEKSQQLSYVEHITDGKPEKTSGLSRTGGTSQSQTSSRASSSMQQIAGWVPTSRIGYVPMTGSSDGPT